MNLERSKVLTVCSYSSARKVLASRDEYGPPAMIEYIELLEKEAGEDFTQLKRFFSAFLPFMHGEKHLWLRKKIKRRFTLSEVRKWQSKIINTIENRILETKKFEKCDLIDDILDALYMDFVEQVFGVSLPDRKAFIQHIDIATKAVERMASLSQLHKLQNTLIELETLITDNIAIPNTETLFGEIVSDLKEEVDFFEISSLLCVLLIAPKATTETLAHIVREFVSSSEENKLRLMSREWVNNHVNDLIRLFASTNLLSKESKLDTVIDGCPVSKGQQVLIDIPKVNRDSTVYGSQISIECLEGRSEKRKHLTFGAGPHICIGAELAKEIIREFVPRFFSAFPIIHCSDDTLTFHKAQIAKRIKRLTVTFK